MNPPESAGSREGEGDSTCATDSALERLSTWISAARQKKLAEILLLMVLAMVVATRALVGEDIRDADEASYLSAGLGFRDGSLPGFTSGAGYSGIYWVLSFIFVNPIDLYFAGRVAAPLIFVGLIWGTVRLLTGRKIALIVAAILVTLPITYIWPGVSTPASGLLILAIALPFKYRGPLAIGLSAALVWVAASMRPEFASPAVVLSLIALIALALWLYRTDTRRVLKIRVSSMAIFLSVGLPSLLVAAFGSPFGGGGRSWVAFVQHFSWRHARPGESNWTDGDTIVERFFPAASSVTEAILINPAAFLTHVGQNALQAPFTLARNILGWHQYDGPFVVFSWMTVTIFLGTLVGLTIARRASLREALYRGWREVRPAELTFAWASATPILMFSLASIILVYPRAHYLILWAAAAFVLAGVYMKTLQNTRLPAVSVAPFLVVVAIMATFLMQSTLSEPLGRMQPTAAALLQMQEIDGKLSVLGRVGNLDTFINRSWVALKPAVSGEEELADFLERVKPDVVFGGAPSKSEPWTSLEGWGEFHNAPEQYGYTRLSEASIFISTNVGKTAPDE